MAQKICIHLSKYERELVEEYGYPFDEISDQLEKCSENPNTSMIKADRYEMEMLLGDLSRSINHQEISDYQTALAVDDLAERIECALQTRLPLVEL